MGSAPLANWQIDPLSNIVSYYYHFRYIAFLKIPLPNIPQVMLATVVFILIFSFITLSVHAQPSPSLQRRISAAIAAASNQSGTPDYTAFVNPFIGTGMWQLSARAFI